MSRHGRRSLCLLLAAAATFLVLAPLTPAEAQPARAVAWWTRHPAATAPAGGFQVADAPDGPVSVAALRLPVGARSVRLPVADEVLGALGALRLCRALSSWAVVAGGALAAAPSYDCSAGASVLARREGSAWVAELGVLERAAASAYGIVVVPETAVIRRPFVLAFAPPQVEVPPSPLPSPRSEPQHSALPAPTGTDAGVPAPPLPLVPLLGAPRLPPVVPRLAPSPAPAPRRADASAFLLPDRSVGLARRLLLAVVALLAGVVAALGRAAGGRMSPHVHRSRPPASLQPDGAS